MKEKDFVISPLEKAHDRKSFSCGVASLDNYLKKQARQDGRRKVAITYVLYDQSAGKIAGYYTLSSTAIELLALPEEIRRKLPSYPCLPATLIGRLAVDALYQKQSLGELILVDAMKRAYRASLKVASFAVAVDTINENAKRFYKKYGFLDLSEAEHQLFLPMSSVAES